MKLSPPYNPITVVLFILLGAATAHADPIGVWRAEDGAHIRVAKCGPALCATIVQARSAVDPETGGPWTDKHNPDPALRGRSQIGVAVLSGMVPDGPGRWSGQLYNVDNGNTYQGHLLDVNPQTVRIEGCFLGICGGRNLSRLQ